MNVDQMNVDQIQKVFLVIGETVLIEGQMNDDPIRTDAHNSLIFNSIPFAFLIKNYLTRTAPDR